MAKKKYSNRKRSGKLEPAVMNLSFTAAGNGTNYIDLSRAASIVNRRFYRQGVNWSVAGFTLTVSGTTQPGTVTICKVPTTWVAYNSWVKSKAMWDRMNDQVLDSEPGVKARYADFKVYLDESMSGAPLQTNILAPATGEILLPTDCSYNLPSTTNAEWEYSTVQIPEDGGALPPVESTLHFVGAPNRLVTPNKLGMIRGYARSRNRPVNTGDPNTPAGTGWMTDLFDVADNLDEVRADLVGDNDKPPYAVADDNTGDDYYPGSSFNLPGTEVVGYASFGATAGATGSITAQRSIKGGNFPCGLLEIKSDLTGPTFYDVIVHLVPGHHRGYLCQPMEDV